MRWQKVEKSDPGTIKYGKRPKTSLKGELKRAGVTYAQLAEQMVASAAKTTPHYLDDKISPGGFTAAFMLQCLEAIGTTNDLL